MSRTTVVVEGASQAQRGFIVVAALWLLAALAGLALVASAYLAQSAIALSSFDATTQLQMLSTAGIELAAYQLSASETARRPMHGSFSFRLAQSGVTVEYRSEAARINLNMAPRAMIAGLFTALGAQPDAAGQFADRVVAWRSPARPNAQDEEDALYRAAGSKYLPRRAPFNSVDELSLVLGLPAALVDRALPFLTVYSGIADVNVLYADPEVVAALPEISPAKLDAFLSQRDSLPPDDPDFVFGTLGGRLAGATLAGSNAYRVGVRITLPDGRESRSEGVILLPALSEKAAYRVYTWRDEIDPATGEAQR